MQACSWVSERPERVPGSLREGVCGTLRAARLGPANESHTRLCKPLSEGNPALRVPGMGRRKRGQKGLLSGEPPNADVKRGSP